MSKSKKIVWWIGMAGLLVAAFAHGFNCPYGEE